MSSDANPFRYLCYVDRDGLFAEPISAGAALVLVTVAVITLTAATAITTDKSVGKAFCGAVETVVDKVGDVKNWILGAPGDGNEYDKNSDSKNKNKEKKQTSPNQMQEQVKNGQAPNSVDRVDKENPDIKGSKPHIHFGDDEATLNNDGTWHDEGKNKPPHNLTNKEKNGLLQMAGGCHQNDEMY